MTGTTSKPTSTKAEAYRLEETRLDRKLEAWPAEPPKAAKTNLERARLALTRVAWRGAPARVTVLGRRGGPRPWRPPLPGPSRPSCTRGPPGPSRPGPTSTQKTRKWRVAARYVPGEADVPLQG